MPFSPGSDGLVGPWGNAMDHFICFTCGTQFAESRLPPEHCPICLDERQFVGWHGQQWTTSAELAANRFNTLKELERGLFGIGIEPSFAIGQRALLLLQPGGNILWDCVPLLDEALRLAILALGGISAIAISHPHYYSSMVTWSRAFGNAPIYLHAADRRWVMRHDPSIIFWEGETRALGDGLTLIRAGGHFEGGTVLHWPAGAESRGVLLSGDIVQVVQDRRYVGFMYSYPNLIPLSAGKVRHIAKVLQPFAFDRIYGAFWGKVVTSNGNEAVAVSAKRYLHALED